MVRPQLLVLGYSRSPPNPHPPPWPLAQTPLHHPGLEPLPGLASPRPPQTAYHNPNEAEKREGGDGILPHIRVSSYLALNLPLPPPPPNKSVISLLKYSSKTSGLSHTSDTLGVCLAPSLILQSPKPFSQTGPSILIPSPSPSAHLSSQENPGVQLAHLPLSFSLYNALLEQDSLRTFHLPSGRPPTTAGPSTPSSLQATNIAPHLGLSPERESLSLLGPLHHLSSGRAGCASWLHHILVLCVIWGELLKFLEPGLLVKIKHLTYAAVLRTK